MTARKEPFNWNEYGGEVLSKLQSIKEELNRVRDKVDNLQPLAGNVELLKDQVTQIRGDIDNLETSIGNLRTEFGKCQLKSVEAGGATKADLVRLEERMSLKNWIVSIIAGIMAIITMVIIKAITGK